MKKISCIIISLFLVLSFVGCGKTEDTSTQANSGKSNGKMLSKEEFKNIYSDPEKFKGDKVDFYAKIFTTPEKDDKGTYFQCYAENDDNKNTMVAIKDPKLDVKRDDIVHIVGTIKKKFKGENAFGGNVVAPVIDADKVEKTDYATAFAPAIKTVDINKEINQHGYKIKLNKVEFAETETRAYITITNNSKDKISFYTFNSKATQGNKQFKTENNYDANYPEIESNILPGIKEEGMLVFKTMDIKGDNVKLILEGRSENYDLDFKPFEFVVKLK